MNRRNLLTAAPAFVVLAGVAAGPAAAAASSPILDAARQIAVLDREHEQADVPGADYAVLDAIWAQVWAQERCILNATPATVTEAMVVLMVATGNLDMASTFDDAGATVNRAMRAAARATRFLAGAEGVTVEEFGGMVYLPDSAAPSCAERAA
jgi:hypothetical protein